MRNSRFGIFLSTFLSAFIACKSAAVAQSTANAPEMADGLRADGKIWVVVVVLATIFAGIIAALIRTDRKITRLERERRQA
jgi:uncharacterized ion transporter superfamily protein YfcC